MTAARCMTADYLHPALEPTVTQMDIGVFVYSLAAARLGLLEATGPTDDAMARLQLFEDAKQRVREEDLVVNP